jgi:4-hydroxybutyrate CoA-transferase
VVSRIVPRLRAGAGVVTTRGHVQWVVTEHGAVNLRARSLRERAELLIRVAHPDVRGELRAAAVQRKLIDLGGC